MNNTYIKNETNKWIVILLLILFFMIIISICLGEIYISPRQVINTLLSSNNSLEREILLYLRLPRIILAIITGALLSLCGTIMQATVQNPLADPFLLGVSSGATLGMTLYLILGFSISSLGMSIFSFGGAFIAILLVLFSQENKGTPLLCLY